MASSARAAFSYDTKHLRILANAHVSADQTSAEIDTLGYAQLHVLVLCGSLGGGSANILVQSSATSGSGYTTITGGTTAAVASTTFVIPVNLFAPTTSRYIVIVYDVTGMTDGDVGMHAMLIPGAGQGNGARPFTVGSNVTLVAEA